MLDKMNYGLNGWDLDNAKQVKVRILATSTKKGNKGGSDWSSTYNVRPIVTGLVISIKTHS